MKYELMIDDLMICDLMTDDLTVTKPALKKWAARPDGCGSLFQI